MEKYKELEVGKNRHPIPYVQSFESEMFFTPVLPPPHRVSKEDKPGNFQSNRFDVPQSVVLQAVPLCLVCACLIQRCVVIEEASTATRVFVKVQQEAFHCAQVPFVGATSPVSHHPPHPSTSTTFISSLHTSMGGTGRQSRTRCFLIMSLEAVEVKVSLIITMFYRSFANPIKTN